MEVGDRLRQTPRGTDRLDASDDLRTTELDMTVGTDQVVHVTAIANIQLGDAS